VHGRHPPGALFNTNQTYLRLSAVRSLIDETGAADAVEGVRRLTDRQMLVLEDKPVLVGGAARRTRQLSLPFHGVLGALRRVDVVVASREIGPGVRSSYSPLKHPTDVRFGQWILDRLQAGDDELALEPA
jgi:hypothetical protein